ncbi:MAG: hypothetical protein NTW59_03950 [Candidatus Diapherotrites archaeon]|nr:hypothetical protein [Candidatus Diapherotrites archaeon]
MAAIKVPKKAWSSKERRQMVSIGRGVRIQMSLLEYLIPKEGKKARENFRAMHELYENPAIPEELKNFGHDLETRKRYRLTREFARRQVANITNCLNRRTMSPRLFTILEQLRLDLINGLRER